MGLERDAPLLSGMTRRSSMSMEKLDAADLKRAVSMHREKSIQKAESNKNVARMIPATSEEIVLISQAIDTSRHDLQLTQEQLFEKYDLDSSGDVDWSEFQDMVRNALKIPLKQIRPDRLQAVWLTFNVNGEGNVTMDEWFEFMRRGVGLRRSQASAARNIKLVPGGKMPTAEELYALAEGRSSPVNVALRGMVREKKKKDFLEREREKEEAKLFENCTFSPQTRRRAQHLPTAPLVAMGSEPRPPLPLPTSRLATGSMLPARAPPLPPLPQPSPAAHAPLGCYAMLCSRWPFGYIPRWPVAWHSIAHAPPRAPQAPAAALARQRADGPPAHECMEDAVLCCAVLCCAVLYARSASA